MIAFKGAQIPKEAILFSVFFFVRYTVTYRDVEEIMEKLGVILDHATLNRWVNKYLLLIANTARRRKAPADRCWRMEETYIREKDEWVYLDRAVDRFGKTLEMRCADLRFMPPKRRNKPAALMMLERLVVWRVRAAAATADLQGRTPAQLIATLAAHPMLGAAQAEMETRASRAALQRNLDVLTARGLAREVTGQGRFRVWAARE